MTFVEQEASSDRWGFDEEAINSWRNSDPMKSEESKYKRIDHPIPPLFDKDSRILILGSFPSVKSREAAFFYGHPRNRFWRILSELLSCPLPETVEEKRNFLHRNHVAVWDVIKSCDIIGSSDSSIRNVIPNDLSEILAASSIEEIFCNGARSFEYYERYLREKTRIKAKKLPSTSPANAAFSPERLKNEWKAVLRPLKAAPPDTGQVLLSWYDYNARLLPWRSDPAPYHVWISEIMLQQTRVEAVKASYDRWMRELPDIKSLAEVSDEKLMKLWEGLGYYNRARNLKEAALSVMEDYGGELPADRQELMKLKGIGQYTSGAIASIAFGLPEAAVDGNVLRVFARLLGESGQIGSAYVKQSITNEVYRVLPHERPGDFNQALMDLGATVCLPVGKPLCDRCPFESACAAHHQGRETDYPVRPQKKERKKEKKTVLVIEAPMKDAEGERGFVLHKRPGTGLLPDLWEFPNLEGTYTGAKVLELADTWGLGDYEIQDMGKGKHIFSHVEWQMRGYRLITAGIPEDLCRKKAWKIVSRGNLENRYAVPSAFELFKKQILDD